MDSTKKRIAVFVSFSGAGGVEKMVHKLVRGFSTTGLLVDLLLIKADSEHLKDLPQGVTPIHLGARSTFASLLPLCRYLKKNPPDAVLAVKDRAGLVAALARALTGFKGRLVLRIGTTVSAALDGQGGLKQWWRFATMRWTYRRVDKVIAVSSGVAEDLIQISRANPSSFVVVPNPTLEPDMFQKAALPVRHPWLQNKTLPVILGVGRLTRQKDFATLIRAFARVQEQVCSRLIILGDGRDKNRLNELARELKVNDRIDFPGFQENPYSFMQSADLFVLSSAWEGSPNALKEALALGCQVVSTDCPSGPREILQDGVVAPLVPVGDANEMAKAITRILAAPVDKTVLQGAVQNYSLENSCKLYRRILLEEESKT